MVNGKLLVAVLVLCVVVGGWLAWQTFRSEERVIKGRLEAMREVAQLEVREGTIPAATSSRKFGSFFANNFYCDAPDLPMVVRQRKELESLMFQARSHLDGIDLHFKDVTVILGENPTNALMRLAARISLDHSGESEVSWKELELTWVRTPDGWQIAAADSLEAIRMP